MYQSAVESTVCEEGESNGENCTGDERKDENDNPSNSSCDDNITGEVEISVVYEEAFIMVENVISGYDEVWSLE